MCDGQQLQFEAGCSEVFLQEVRFGALGSCECAWGPIMSHVFLDHGDKQYMCTMRVQSELNTLYLVT